MKTVDIPINEIVPYDNNPRRNEKAVEKVAESIRQYGFMQPLVVDAENVIIVGHTRFEAAKMLGFASVPCVKASNLSEEQARAYRIADNKVADYSIWDNKKLLEELDEISDDLFTGFVTSDLFSDILDENDNSVLEDNDKGVTYEVVYKTQSRERAEEARGLCDALGNI